MKMLVFLLVLFCCSPSFADRVYSNEDLTADSSNSSSGNYNETSSGAWKRIYKEYPDNIQYSSVPVSVPVEMLTGQDKPSFMSGIFLSEAVQVVTEHYILSFIVALFFILFVFFCIADIMHSRFRGHEQIIWLIVVGCVPVAGALLYYFIGSFRKQDIPAV